MTTIKLAVKLVQRPQAPVLQLKKAKATAARIGQRGIPGPPAEALLVVATQSIIVGRLVTVDAAGNTLYYDSTNAAHAYAFTGIAINSANAGESLKIQIIGTAEVPGWGLVPGSVYLAGPNGQLTTSLAPDAIFAQIIGRAITENKFSINPQTIIFKTDA